MLIQIKFTNYRSFRDEQVLSLIASKADKALPDNKTAVPSVKDDVLLSGVIYGPNASGKTNVIKALNFLQTMVETSADASAVRSNSSLADPFRLDADTINAPSEIEVIFVHAGIRYEYGFVVGRRRVHKEWLIAYPHQRAQMWFTRTLDLDTETYHYEYGPRLQGPKKRLEEVTQPNALFLSVGSAFGNPQLAKVADWFEDQLLIIPHTTRVSTTMVNSVGQRLKEDANFKKRIQAILSAADLGIADFQIIPLRRDSSDGPENHLLDSAFRKLLAWVEEKGGPFWESVFYHTDEEGQIIQQPFDEEDESLGTIKMFGFANILLETLDNGYILVVDELDSSLHPLLVQAIVALFHNPEINTKGAQLIFNTHDVTLLDLDTMRRDQIWFVEKGSDGATQLFSLVEFNERNSAAISKKYLIGRYGAIPFIGDLVEVPRG